MKPATESMILGSSLFIIFVGLMSIVLWPDHKPASVPLTPEVEYKDWECYEYKWLFRAKVPGGYLYRYSGYENMVFVPD